MISREDVAKELYVQRWVRTGDTRESAEAAWKAGWADQDVRECRADADAILALIQPEVAEAEGVLEVETSARKYWEERARNADALATNLRRLDNERAIEVMRVKRDLATMDDAVGRLVRAVDAYTDYPSGDAMTEVMSSLSSPVFTMWRRK